MLKSKSYVFALDIVLFIKKLTLDRNNQVLIHQLLRCGTSVGANVEEANGAQTKKDFNAKIYIAYKEARESRFWLRLLRDAKVADVQEIEQLLMQCEELLRIMGRIISTLKQDMQ